MSRCTALSPLIFKLKKQPINIGNVVIGSIQKLKIKDKIFVKKKKIKVLIVRTNKKFLRPDGSSLFSDHNSGVIFIKKNLLKLYSVGPFFYFYKKKFLFLKNTRVV